MNKHVWHKEIVPEDTKPPDMNAKVGIKFPDQPQEELSASVGYGTPGSLQNLPVPGPKIGINSTRDDIQFGGATNRDDPWAIPNHMASRGSSENTSVSGQQQTELGAPFLGGASSDIDNLMADIDWVSRGCLWRERLSRLMLF